MTDTSKQIVVVSGLPRSGTSMMMKMLEAGGLKPLTDEIREADVDNPKGYYEWERAKKMPEGDTAWLPQAEGKAVKIISALLKHLPADHQYKVIFMRREMGEILASQQRMLEHRGEGRVVDDAKMAELFEKHLAATQQWLAQQPNVRVLYVSYNEILEDAAPHIKRVAEFVGGLDAARMQNVVDERLYRQRS